MIETNALRSFDPAKRRNVVLGGAMLAALAGCGGNGATSPTPIETPTPTPPSNRAPSFTSDATVSFAENGTGTVYQATATDADGDPITYTISGGADAARFAISSTGVLTFATSPSYDLPGDADGDNVYLVQISASDGKASTNLSLSVTVTNLKEGIAVHRIATGFNDPVAISPLPGGDLLVAEKAGAIYRFTPQSGTKTLVYQLTDLNGGRVITLTAAPDFASTGKFHVMYFTGNFGLVANTYLRNPAGPTYPSGEGYLLTAGGNQYAGGGWMGYDASGTLIIATGDGGYNVDPSENAQIDYSRFGKVFRVVRTYDPYAGASPIYFTLSMIAKGVRYPAGGALVAGGLLFADRGQNAFEEVNFLNLSAMGVGNLGWAFKDGTTTIAANAPAGLIDPVLQYPHGTGQRAGNAIVGGVVGGNTPASLASQYVFGDESGGIFSVPVSSIVASQTLSAAAMERRDADFAPDAGTIDHPVAFARDANGVIYILDADGEIFRVDAG